MNTVEAGRRLPQAMGAGARAGVLALAMMAPGVPALAQPAPTGTAALPMCNSPEYRKLVGPQKYKAPPRRMTPGFYVRNETPHVVDLSLQQVGPLYWGMIQPGETLYRKTGAVWFTMKASYNIDGKEKYNTWDAVWPVAATVGASVLGLATGGASLAAAKTAYAAGLGAAATLKAAAPAIGKATFGAVKGMATQVAAQDFSADMAQHSLAGQYAGPEWPFRDTLEVYRITGNPAMPCMDANGEVNMDGVGQGQRKPLRIVAPDEQMPGESKFVLGIDCHGSGVANAGTRNEIAVTFFNGKERLRTRANRVPECGAMKDENGFFAYGKNVTHVEVRNTGNDAFWMDEVMLEMEGKKLIGHWGRDNGKGYCVAKDGKADGGLAAHADGCHPGIRFQVHPKRDVNSNKAYPLKR